MLSMIVFTMHRGILPFEGRANMTRFMSAVLPLQYAKGFLFCAALEGKVMDVHSLRASSSEESISRVQTTLLILGTDIVHCLLIRPVTLYSSLFHSFIYNFFILGL